MGKTRLVAEGMARAAAGGMVVVRGECLLVTGTLPLLPVASALGELARLDGGRLLEAVLGAAPGFVRAEVARLVPALGPGGGPGADDRGGGWQRERLFAAVAQLLSTVAVRSETGVGVVVEDVHWADSETLDFLTFLSRAAWPGAVRVVVTCRSDAAPVAPPVAGWFRPRPGVRGQPDQRHLGHRRTGSRHRRPQPRRVRRDVRGVMRPSGHLQRRRVLRARRVPNPAGVRRQQDLASDLTPPGPRLR